MSPLAEKMARIFALTAEESRVLDRACSRTLSLAAREDIIQEGDRPWVCNLLLTGTVCRYRVRDGRRQIMAFQHPGDLFDAYSFILEVMDHSIATVSPCRIALVEHEAMLEIVERHPRIARAVWKDTLIDAAVAAQWTSNARFMVPIARLAHLICEVSVRRAVVHEGEGERLEWPMTSGDIADAFGIPEMDVENAFAAFERDGVIAREPGILLVRDLDALRGMADFDPAYLHLEPPRGAAGRTLATDWVKPL